MLDQCHNIEPKIAGPDPFGDERPGGDGQGAAGRRRRAGPRPARRATCSAPTRCSWTPTTPTSGRCSPSIRADHGLDPDPVAAYHRSGYYETDLRRAGRRRPGGLGGVRWRRRASDVVDELIARSNRLGADPRNTNYAGGNTSAKGEDVDPVTGRAGRAAVGQGLRRRPRHAHAGRARRAPARPAAGARRRLPGRRARGRDGRRLRLLPPRQGRRGAVDRHRDARARRRRRTSTTSIPTPASPWPPRPTARR